MSQDQFQKPYSDETAKMIDEEVRRMIDKQYIRAQKLLSDHREELEILARQLLETEVLLKSDVERLIGVRPFSERKQEETATRTESGQEARDPELGQPERAPGDDV